MTYNIVVLYSGIDSDLSFNTLPDSALVNFQLVGGGGGGSSGYEFIAVPPNNIANTGSGGGGGGNLLVPYTLDNSEEFIIKVGKYGDNAIVNIYNNIFYPTNGGDGGDTIITSNKGLNLTTYGGKGGKYSDTSGNAVGGDGGGFSSNVSGSGGQGGNGGQGATLTYEYSGSPGTPSYFYLNQTLTFSPSTSYPSINFDIGNGSYPYQLPFYVFYPYEGDDVVITIEHWYQMSGGGGGGSLSNNIPVEQASYQNGGSGFLFTDSLGAGRSGNSFQSGDYANPPPNLPTFGGGGGGQGIITSTSFPGGPGIVVIWFSYTNS